MHADPVPVIDQIKVLDKAALLRVKYAVQEALKQVLPKGVVARHRIPATDTVPEHYFECMKTRCGRKTCPQCNCGAGHGPYWFRFWFVANSTGQGRRVRKSKYIGRTLPDDIKALISLHKEDRGLEDPVRVEHSMKVGGSKLGRRAFRKVARSLATEVPAQG